MTRRDIYERGLLAWWREACRLLMGQPTPGIGERLLTNTARVCRQLEEPGRDDDARRPIPARIGHEARRLVLARCPYRTLPYNFSHPDPRLPLPPDEYLSCGCWAASARAHHPLCRGRNVLVDGHYWSRQELDDDWHHRAVLAGQLWQTTTPICLDYCYGAPHRCLCDGCRYKPLPWSDEDVNRIALGRLIYERTQRCVEARK